MQSKKQKLDIKKIASYYVPHIKKYKKTFFAVFFFYGTGMALWYTGIPFFYKELVDIITHGERKEEIAEDLWRIVFYVGITVFFGNIFFRIANYSKTYCINNIYKSLSDFTFTKIQNHSYTFFADEFAGSLLSRAHRFIHAFGYLFDNMLWNVWTMLLQLIFILCILTWYAHPIEIVLLCWICIFLMINYFFIKKKIPLDIAEGASNSQTSGQFSDVLTNILTTKIFATHKNEVGTFTRYTSTEKKKRDKAGYFDDTQQLVLGTLAAILEVSVIALAVKLWLDSKITTGTIILIQAYLGTIFNYIFSLGNSLTYIQKSLTNAKEMIDTFEKVPDVLDPENPEKCIIKSGNISFKNITFRYTKKEKDVFHNFSLDIPSGQKIGLIGHSGSGKSTLTKLLLRFVNVQSGHIYIDNHDITKITQDDLRRNIAYVPQEPLLFHRSLKENIAYAKNNAKMSTVIAASKAAHAHEFIDNLTKKYNTRVGERGVKLSGGERQRVAIARVMLKNAPILILDEATSALDSVSEKLIKEAFSELMKDKTTIVIAHRLSTIQKMDRIIVLDNGKIIEDGTHTELLAKKGSYYTFWKQQSNGFID